MNKKSTSPGEKLDQRKKDHIQLAMDSQILPSMADTRFYYEPLIKAHPGHSEIPPFYLASKSMRFPLWVSSMTGGTASAREINTRLAKVSKEFGLGMGLGSCRIILDDDQYFKDFHVRPILGDETPLFANLGIAQLEQIAKNEDWGKVIRLITKLEADGLIIHVNPLQELLQPEGDDISKSPLETIRLALRHLKVPVIVKEVGQGMGPKSLESLLRLPLEAIEFAALGGTNFSILELKRAKSTAAEEFSALSQVGHTAIEMVEMVNIIGATLKSKMKCKSFIISGGIKNFLDGYHLIQKLNYPAAYGQASGLLGPARQGYSQLYDYVKGQVRGFQIANNYLEVR